MGDLMHLHVMIVAMKTAWKFLSDVVAPQPLQLVAMTASASPPLFLVIHGRLPGQPEGGRSAEGGRSRTVRSAEGGRSRLWRRTIPQTLLVTIQTIHDLHVIIFARKYVMIPVLGRELSTAADKLVLTACAGTLVLIVLQSQATRPGGSMW